MNGIMPATAVGGSPWMTGDPVKDGPSLEDLTGGNKQEQTASDFARSDSNPSWLNSLIDKANAGDTSAYEKLIDYYMTEDSAKTAREWTAQREDNQYQRLMDDLRKAGVSPYVLSGATPGVSSSAGKSYSGSQITTNKNKETDQALTALRDIFIVMGIVAKLAMA